jgi:hypothetical protein
MPRRPDGTWDDLDGADPRPPGEPQYTWPEITYRAWTPTPEERARAEARARAAIAAFQRAARPLQPAAPVPIPAPPTPATDWQTIIDQAAINELVMLEGNAHEIQEEEEEPEPLPYEQYEEPQMNKISQKLILLNKQEEGMAQGYKHATRGYAKYSVIDLYGAGADRAKGEQKAIQEAYMEGYNEGYEKGKKHQAPKKTRPEPIPLP